MSKLYYRNRYMLCALASMGMLIIQMLKHNINATMHNIQYRTYVELRNNSGYCKTYRNETGRHEIDVFKWPTEIQELIMNSYYWGSLFGTLPGGILADRWSPKWVWFIAMAVNVLGCFLTPVAGGHHYITLLVVRIIQGMAAGMTNPATSAILATWMPEHEKNRSCAIVFSSSVLGVVFARLSAVHLKIMLDWTELFYLMGSVGAGWLILWGTLVYDSPLTAKFTSQREIDRILASNDHVRDKNVKVKVLWRSIFMSQPFWALLVGHCSTGTVMFSILQQLPVYLWVVLQFSMVEVVQFITIIYSMHWVFAVLFGATLDILKARDKIDQTWALKISTIVGCLPPMVCLMAVGYVGCNRTVAITLIIIALMCQGSMYSGIMSNHTYIGPRVAGTIMGLTNTVAIIGGILFPLFMSKITDENPDMSSWIVIFWICMGFFITALIVYTVWGTAEHQEYYTEETKVV